jgi:WD40 repeat protein/mono/diheme cytochrome c family protein
MKTWALLALGAILGSAAAAADVSYAREIRPILQRQCQGCHQPNVKSFDLDLTSYEAMMAGGKSGRPIEAGAPDRSLLLRYLTGEVRPQMPMGLPPLPNEQVDLIRRWVLEGAKDDTPAEARETVSLDKPVTYTQPPVITSLAFSPDGAVLAVSGYREVLLIPAAGSLPAKRLAGMSERIQSLAFSADGALLVAAGGTPARFGEVQFWNAPAGTMLRSVSLTGDTVFGASLSPDASKVAVGCADNTVRILDAATGAEVHRIGNHENWVLGTVFGKDGKRIVSVGRDRAAKLTDVASGAFLENINLLRGELAAVARHPSQEVVVIGGEDRIPYVYLMDRPKNMKIADDTTLLRQLERQEGAIFALAWSPDGRQIAVAGASPAVTLYDAESGKRLGQCIGHTAGIYALAYAPDSKLLATGGFEGQVRLYEAASGRLVREFIPVPIETSSVRRERP